MPYPKCPKGHEIFTVRRLVLVEQITLTNNDGQLDDWGDADLGDIVESNRWRAYCRECRLNYLVDVTDGSRIIITAKVYRPSKAARRYAVRFYESYQ